MKLFRQSAAVARKDLVIELRGRPADDSVSEGRPEDADAVGVGKEGFHIFKDVDIRGVLPKEREQTLCCQPRVGRYELFVQVEKGFGHGE